MDTIEVGCYVRLAPRERPYEGDDPAWWWLVTAVHDYGFDAVYSLGARVDRCRRGVPFSALLGAPRKADES